MSPLWLDAWGSPLSEERSLKLMSTNYELLEDLGLLDILEELRDEIRLLRETIGQAAGL